jgi:transcription elongation factor GreA
MSSLAKFLLPLLVNALKAEFSSGLKSADRPAVINAILEARAQGDFIRKMPNTTVFKRKAGGFCIEGCDPGAGKLKASPARDFIDPHPFDDDAYCVAGLPQTVDPKKLNSAKSNFYQIVGEDEADIKQGVPSFSSPILYRAFLPAMFMPSRFSQREIVDAGC